MLEDEKPPKAFWTALPAKRTDRANASTCIAGKLTQVEATYFEGPPSAGLLCLSDATDRKFLLVVDHA